MRNQKTLIFQNKNHLGDALLQLGLLRMLHKQHKVDVGFIVNGALQHEAIRATEFLRHDFYPTDNEIIEFKADDFARMKGLTLIEMWAQSIPYELKGRMRPFIQLTKYDYKEAHKLRLMGKVFIAPFKATCLNEPELYEGQQYLKDKFMYNDYHLLGSQQDLNWIGSNVAFNMPNKCHFGLPIRTVGVLLKEARAVYCINNGLANLAWAVGQRRIYEWITPASEWAKVPYSRRLN